MSIILFGFASDEPGLGSDLAFTRLHGCAARLVAPQSLSHILQDSVNMVGLGHLSLYAGIPTLRFPEPTDPTFHLVVLISASQATPLP